VLFQRLSTAEWLAIQLFGKLLKNWIPA